MSQLYFQCAARSAVGLVRNGNEDSALSGSQVIAVADGMGGHAGGEVASSVAINTLAEIAPTFTNSDIDVDSASDLFLNSLHTIDAQIHQVAQDEPQLAGMGTTLTSLFVSGEEVSLLHIGDSRAYRLRGGNLEQLSADHQCLLVGEQQPLACQCCSHARRQPSRTHNRRHDHVYPLIAGHITQSIGPAQNPG